MPPTGHSIRTACIFVKISETLSCSEGQHGRPLSYKMKGERQKNQDPPPPGPEEKLQGSRKYTFIAPPILNCFKQPIENERLPVIDRLIQIFRFLKIILLIRSPELKAKKSIFK